jgi:hypothetical protein
MDQAKKFLVPALLAYAGMQLASAIGVKGDIGKIVAGVLGAGGGIFVASKF